MDDIEAFDHGDELHRASVAHDCIAGNPRGVGCTGAVAPGRTNGIGAEDIEKSGDILTTSRIAGFGLSFHRAGG